MKKPRCLMPAVLFLFVLMNPALFPMPSDAGPCEDLAKLSLPDTTITLAESVSPPFVSPTSSFGSATVSSASFCRVVAVAKPTGDSNINFEVWLPATGWNGKFQGVGNGALGGGINYPAMSAAFGRGYAVASTDTGHVGLMSDASWALTVTPRRYHPEKVIDLGHRAIHAMTEAGKAITRNFYGAAPRYSYFTGCSGGGQQGLSEAQRYPRDYDGIVTGAPSNYFTHLDAGQIWRAQANLKDPASFISSGLLTVINKAALAKCDGLDGVIDGILSDPRRCGFDPSALLCQAGADPNTCLTPAQAEAVKKLYSGPVNPRTGEQVFPGFPVGSEAGWGPFIGAAAGPFFKKPSPIADSFFKYVVFEDPGWNYLTFDFDKDMALTDAKMIKPGLTLAAAVNSTNPDLSAFKTAGGKLIMYHGWNDPNIPALNSIHYYGSVTAGQGDGAQDFYRLFLVPGMGHCSGGPGTDQFDALLSLEQWIEKGIAPNSIPASHLTNGAVTMTRPLCPYPKEAVYTGQGGTDDAANFRCEMK